MVENREKRYCKGGGGGGKIIEGLGERKGLDKSFREDFEGRRIEMWREVLQGRE